MTGQEAFEIIRKRKPLVKVRGCLDYGTFYAFCLAPIYVNDNEEYFTGTVMDAVDKKTGRVFMYDISSDIDAYERAKNVDISDVFDTPISEVTKYVGI